MAETSSPALTRQDFALSCRVYRSEHGFAGQPDAQLMRDAFASVEG
jgi:hypothetical protein